MKTNVTETSIEAYHSLENKQTQEQRVIDLLIKRTKGGAWTGITDIAKEFGWEKSTASARLNKVKSYGQIMYKNVPFVLYKSEKPIKCKYTGKSVNKYILVVNRKGIQQEMF